MKRIKTKCKATNCENNAKALGYCVNHYYLAKKHGDEYALKHIINTRGSYKENPLTCIYVGCNDKHYARGYCERHYSGLLLNKNSTKEYKESNQRTKDPVYHIYAGMIDRCNKPNASGYKNYGDRGIKVCKRWLNSFEDFKTDMGKRPSKKHSIERVNNDGDYEPSNCKWATSKEQMRNTRRMKLSVQKVAVIKTLLKIGVKQCLIANSFEIDDGSISKIKQGKIWADVKPIIAVY